MTAAPFPSIEINGITWIRDSASPEPAEPWSAHIDGQWHHATDAKLFPALVGDDPMALAVFQSYSGPFAIRCYGPDDWRDTDRDINNKPLGKPFAWWVDAYGVPLLPGIGGIFTKWSS